MAQDVGRGVVGAVGVGQAAVGGDEGEVKVEAVLDQPFDVFDLIQYL